MGEMKTSWSFLQKKSILNNIICHIKASTKKRGSEITVPLFFGIMSMKKLPDVNVLIK